jgi:hypothetical protein
MPGGIVDAERGQLPSTFGSSSKTSACIVDALEAWWAALEETEQVAMTRLQINMDHGPESSGKRTQFVHRMVKCCEAIGKPMQLPGFSAKYPPAHAPGKGGRVPAGCG